MKNRYSQVYGCSVQKIVVMAALWFAVIFVGAAANADITVDNSASVAINDTSPITINDFTINDNSNRLLIVMIGNEYGDDNIESVTFGGVDMDLQVKNTGSKVRQTFIYSLANPPVGTTDDIVLTWATTIYDYSPNLFGRADSLVAAMSLYGDSALEIIATNSGGSDDTGDFTTDQATEAFFYAGISSDNGSGANASPTFDDPPFAINYDSGNALLQSHSSRARGHYFGSGTGGASLEVTNDDSFSRIAIRETSAAAVAKINAAAVANDASGITLADIASVDGLSFTPIAANLSYYQTAIANASGFADAAAIDAAFNQPMLITVNTALGLTVDIRLAGSISDVNVEFDSANLSSSNVCDAISTSAFINGGTTNATTGSVALIDGPTTLSCTYNQIGIYTITITGSFSHYGWGATGLGPVGANVAAITEVTQWNLVGLAPTLTSLDGAFWNHANLRVVPDTLPSTATRLMNTFKDAIMFNQDLSGWDTSGVGLMNAMFQGARLSVDNYDRLIEAWNIDTYTLFNKSFHGGYSVFCDATDPLITDGNNSCDPQIVRTTLADDFSTITVTWSKPVFTNSDGTGALTVNDYVLSITGSGASLAATPTSISQKGNSYILGLGLSDTLNSDQVISVLPAP